MRDRAFIFLCLILALSLPAAPVRAKENTPPVLAPIGDKTLIVGELLQFSVTANDSDNDTLTFSASNLPEGAVFSAVNASFSWRPDTEGNYPGVVFSVSDGKKRVSESISIFVIAPPTPNTPPVLAPIGDKTVIAGELLQFTVSATDSDDDSLSFSASNLPEGAGFNAAAASFSWTPLTEGFYEGIVFTVSDGEAIASETISISVIAPTPPNTPPVLAPIGDKTVMAEELLQFTVSATDSDDDSLSFSASNLPEGAGFNAAAASFSWTPLTEGFYEGIVFTVSDGEASASETISISVIAPTPPNTPPVMDTIGDKSTEAGKLLDFTISATDAENDSLVFWASNIPPGSLFDDITGTFSWTPASAGVYPDIWFSVTDGEYIDSQGVTITVTEPPHPNNPPVLGPIGDKRITVALSLEFTVSATDADQDILTYSASNLPEGATFDVSSRTFKWTPASTGTFSGIRFTVSDGNDAIYEEITITVVEPQPSKPVPEPSPGGSTGIASYGGGGGGATQDKRITSLTGSISESGMLHEDVKVKSLDNRLHLEIKNGTLATNRNGRYLYNITITTIENPGAYQGKQQLIGAAYEMRPQGAFFEPEIALTIEYDESGIPEGAAEEKLFIAGMNEQEWIAVDSTVNIYKNTVTTMIKHFSIYAVMASTLPADFETADFSISPGEIGPGKSASVDVLIRNAGDLAGSYPAIIEVDGEKLEEKSIDIPGRDEAFISFEVSPTESGIHIISVNGVEGMLRVLPTPASFEMDELDIAPAIAQSGENVNVSFTVINSGEAGGDCTVNCTLDGEKIQINNVYVPGGSSKKTVITLSAQETGMHTVSINGRLTGYFLVKAPAPAPPAPRPVASPDTNTETMTNRLETSPDSSSPDIHNSALRTTLLGLAGGLLILAILTMLFVYNRKR